MWGITDSVCPDVHAEAYLLVTELLISGIILHMQFDIDRRSDTSFE